MDECNSSLILIASAVIIGLLGLIVAVLCIMYYKIRKRVGTKTVWYLKDSEGDNVVGSDEQENVSDKVETKIPNQPDKDNALLVNDDQVDVDVPVNQSVGTKAGLKDKKDVIIVIGAMVIGGLIVAIAGVGAKAAGVF